MIDVVILQVGQLQTNCYLAVDQSTRKTLIIDPGDDADYIQRILKDRNCIPEKIISTHGHFDHCLAAEELKILLGVPYLIHQSDRFLLHNITSSVKHFLHFNSETEVHADSYLKGEQVFKLGPNKIEIIETPGHTPGSISLHFRSEKKLFSGDLLFFNGGIGRTDFSYSNHDKLQKSVKKIFTLDDNTIIYPGHGPAMVLGKERRFHEDVLN